MKNNLYKITICLIGLILSVSSLYYFYLFYEKNSFLPAPFLMDRYDTFMDFYNVNWWANRGDFYSMWRGFYSPLNIYIANLINDPLCVNSITSIRYRICNPDLYYPFGIICTAISFTALLIYSRKNLISIILVLIFSVSMPYLFAIERGNYIILCFMILCISMLINNALIYTIIYAILVNIKFYIFLPSLLTFYNIRYSVLFIFLSTFLLIFFSYFIVDPQWYLIPYNILNFSGYIPSSLNMLWNATTFSHVDMLFSQLGFNVFLVSYIKLAVIFFKSYIIFRFYLFIKNSYKNNIEQLNIFYVTILFMLTFSSSLNYYSIILIYPYFLYLNNKHRLSNTSITTIVMLCIPNIYTLLEPTWIYKTYTPDNSVYGWHLTIISQDLSVTSITTPILIFALFLQLTQSKNYETIK